MSKEFKQSFFTSLLVVLLVISNLIGLKLTNFFDMTISVAFLTFPFTFLCTLLIYNMGGKNAAYRAIIIAVLIQVFITISYSLAVSLGTQAEVPDIALAVNKVFSVNESNILSSIVAFLTSHYALVFIYDSFKKSKKELFGVSLGLLAALFLDTVIYNISVFYKQDFMYVVNALLSNIIVSIIMLVIITIMFYILKEKESETVEIKDMNISVNNYPTNDLALEDVINEKKIENLSAPKKKNTTYQRKKGQQSKNNSSNNNKRNQLQIIKKILIVNKQSRKMLKIKIKSKK